MSDLPEEFNSFVVKHVRNGVRVIAVVRGEYPEHQLENPKKAHCYLHLVIGENSSAEFYAGDIFFTAAYELDDSNNINAILIGIKELADRNGAEFGLKKEGIILSDIG